MTTVEIPTGSDVVLQQFLLEPLGGPKDTFYYLWRFPEEIYTKAPDSHLYKYLRALLGENGVNWIRKNYLQARILLEELGIELFDLDKYFGSPLQFGRILEEQLAEDPYGLIPKDVWETIKAKDARYRNRALDYFNGARAGNTPLGMRLASKAGLGHDVEIIENYRFLFDAHTDDPLGLGYYGQTKSTEEMIVLPRREVGQDEQQVIWFAGEPELPNAGDWYIIYDGHPSVNYPYEWQYYTRTDDGFASLKKVRRSFIPFNASADEVRTALEAIPAIGANNVDVQGGPLPTRPVIITFKGKLGNKDIAELDCQNYTLGYYDPGSLFPKTDNPVFIRIATTIGGREVTDEAVFIPAADMYFLESAVDRIRPQTTIMSLGSAKGLRERQDWGQVFPSSEYVEAVRFVSGNPDVAWLPPNANKPNVYWIESGIEKLAPRVKDDLRYHYTGYHNVSVVEASTMGVEAGAVLTADRILADYAEPLVVTSATEHRLGTSSLVNGIYPTEYQTLPGVPTLKYNEEQYWASARSQTDEQITLRFPFVTCANYLMMEIWKMFLTVNVEYDAYDGTDDALWIPVTPIEPYSNFVIPAAEQDTNPWELMSLTFVNRKQEMIWTRALRITFTRSGNSLTDRLAVKVRNLRTARNVG
jgi:hypothetical protein